MTGLGSEQEVEKQHIVNHDGEKLDNTSVFMKITHNLKSP
jgi:hypothetical protein